MEACDVAIVGGGPAGSSCAYGLRGAGLDVRVLDGRSFPRDKVCAGWITPAVLAAVEVDADAYAADHVLQPIHGFSVSVQGQRSIDVDHGRVVSYAIRRCELDTFLLRRSGATLELGRPVRSVRRDGADWLVDDRLRARVLVGAGGHFCPVARAIHAEAAAEEGIVVARESEAAMEPPQQHECRVRAELPELIFCRDLRGYGWAVRKGAWLNLGLGRETPVGLPGQAEELLGYLRARGRIPAGAGGQLRGHAYGVYGRSRRPLVREGAVLVGDAAGLADARSGEGIRPAVESGLMAAEAIRGCLRRGGSLPRYAAEIEARFGARDRPPRALVGRLPERWRGALGGWLLGVPWIARGLVVDRWFLHQELRPLRVMQTG